MEMSKSIANLLLPNPKAAAIRIQKQNKTRNTSAHTPKTSANWRKQLVIVTPTTERMKYTKFDVCLSIASSQPVATPRPALRWSALLLIPIAHGFSVLTAWSEVAFNAPRRQTGRLGQHRPRVHRSNAHRFVVFLKRSSRFVAGVRWVCEVLY